MRPTLAGRYRRLWVGLAIVGFVLFQTVAYAQYLPLSLGPRVVLQPQLIKQGFLLYDNIADEHAPLLTLILTTWTYFVKDGFLIAKGSLLVLIGLITLVVFWSSSWKYGRFGAFVSTLFFVLWSPLFGFSKLWHETILALLYVSVLWVIQSRREISPSPRVFSSVGLGLLFGAALMTKQHAAVVVGAYYFCEIAFCWFHRRKLMPTVLKEVATGLMVIAGLGLGYALFHLLTGGTLRSLIYWTVQFNFINDYAQLASKPPSIAEIRALAPAYLLLIPFLLKLVWQWRQQDGWAHAHTFVLLLTSSLTIIPRFGSFHLQPSLPILAWVSGSIFADVARADRVEADPGMSQISKALMASIVGLWIVQCGFGYYSLQFTNEGPPKIWEYSPLLSLADDLSGYIRPGESILLLPDDEGVGNLYYLLDKQPPRSWVMTSYPWFGLETITEQTLAALRARPPDWVIYFPTRWGIESHNPTLVAYVREHYETQYRLEWEEGEVLIMGRRISADNNNESARKHSHCCMTKAELGGVTSLAPY